MIANFFTVSRIAGILLLLSLLLLLIGLGFVATQGKLEGMAVAFRGVGPPFRDASGLRIMAGFALPAFMALLAGFTLLTMLAYDAPAPSWRPRVCPHCSGLACLLRSGRHDFGQFSRQRHRLGGALSLRA